MDFVQFLKICFTAADPGRFNFLVFKFDLVFYIHLCICASVIHMQLTPSSDLPRGGELGQDQSPLYIYSTGKRNILTSKLSGITFRNNTQYQKENL